MNVNAIPLNCPPRRVVSLVPSLTESLFDLGLGKALVGITDYCPLPAQSSTAPQRLGGTRTPHIAAILALQPDLVLANQEENPRQAIEALQQAGLHVWVTFPKTVYQAIEILFDLVDIFRSEEAGLRVRHLLTSLDWVELATADRPKVRTFCPIWQGETDDGHLWWMTFNHDTYAHDLLRLVGGENVFAERLRRYPLEADLGLQAAEDPGERDTRYPCVSLAEVKAAQPQMILLPSEPFPFSDHHRQRLKSLLPDTPAVRDDRLILLDGRLITWHGTRLGQALRDLPPLFAER